MSPFKHLVLIPALFISFAQAATIGIIDTGFDLDHEFLRPRIMKQETDEELGPQDVASSTNFMVGRGFHKKMLHMQQGPQHTPADPENSKAPTKRGFGVIQQRLGSGADIDGLLVQSTFGFKGYMAIDQSKQSVVATNADVAAGVEFGTTLAHEALTIPFSTPASIIFRLAQSAA
jgi:hypothetical protein